MLLHRLKYQNDIFIYSGGGGSLVRSDFFFSKASKAIWLYTSLPLVNDLLVSWQLLLPRKGTWFLTVVPHC